MSATVPPQSAAEVFSRPFDMSTLKQDDDGGSSPASTDDTDDTAGDEPGEDEPDAPVAKGNEDHGEDGSDEQPPAKAGKTFWDQVPEDKRPQAFNDTKVHSQKVTKELEAEREARKALEEKLSKYEKPDSSPEPKPVQAWIDEALGDKVEGLSEGQLAARKIASDLLEDEKQTVQPAKAAMDEATKALDDVAAKIQRKRNVLEDLKERSSGDRKGYYDGEIQEVEKELERLETAESRAQAVLGRAEVKFYRALETQRNRQASARLKVDSLASDEGRKHREAASQKADEKAISAEQAVLNKHWDSALETSFKRLKLTDREDIELAEDRAFQYVQRVEKKRVAEGKPSVTAAEFETLVLEALKPIAKMTGRSLGIKEAEIADVRAAATAQPGPQKRTAKGGSGARPVSTEEAADELRRAMRNVRTRPAA